MNKLNKKCSMTDIVIMLVLGVCILIFLYPFIYVVSASLSNPTKIAANPILLYPKDFTLDTYKLLMSYDIVWTGYLNSIIYTSVGTTLNVTFTIMAAYSLSRPVLPGKKFFLIFIMLTMFFGGGLIPTFLVMKSLGLLNTRFAVIFPGMVSAWNLFLSRAYIQKNIPNELREATMIDGGGEVVFFRKILLPLSIPIITVIALFYGAGHWNSFFSALIYLRDRNLYPLQLILREILLLSDVQTDILADASVDIDSYLATIGIQYAIIVVAILPLLAAFPFVQKYFVKGMMIGSLKE